MNRWLGPNEPNPYGTHEVRLSGRIVGRYYGRRGSRHYVTCEGCGNGARKWKHVQHRRSCPTHFVRMCEEAKKMYGKEASHEREHLRPDFEDSGAVRLG